MTSLPRFFEQGGERNVISFDWYDFNTGIGYKDLYLTKLFTSGASAYSIVPETIPAAIASTSHSNSALNEIFDFYTPVTFKINGNIFIQMPLWLVNTDGTNNWTMSPYTFKLYKYDGTTETQIGYTISGSYPTGVIIKNTSVYNLISGIIDTNGQIVVKAGEYLRLRVSGAATGDTDFTAYHYHDPSNAAGLDGAILTRTSLISIPLKVDL